LLGPRNLTLRSGGFALGSWELEIEPRLWELTAEDAAWSIAIADWQGRRPSWLHWMARIRWRQDGSRHRIAGDQLRATAHELGLRAGASHGSSAGAALRSGRSY
jgi:hypothetical protein